MESLARDAAAAARVLGGAREQTAAAVRLAFGSWRDPDSDLKSLDENSYVLPEKATITSKGHAEPAPSTRDPTELTAFLDRLATTYDPITPAAAHLAGLTFKRYRIAGGPRQHLIPDFIIAAHALTQSHRLAAIDRGYLRTWLPNLKLLEGGGA